MSGRRLLVVEDDPRMRRAVEAVLAAGPHRPVVVGTAREALATLRSRAFDLALVDLGLPDLDGVELIASVCSQWPTLPVLAFTVDAGEARILAALKAGARGYLLKEDLHRQLDVALAEALRGGLAVSPHVARVLVARAQAAPPGDAPMACDTHALTGRERELLQRLALGWGYQEVAVDLAVSVNTVRSHVRSLYAKLEVTNRVEAVQVAVARGLLPR